jgi:HEAT repeat protein
MTGADPAIERAARLAALGHAPPGDAATADELVAALDDPDARVRAAALGALARRADPPLAHAWRTALADDDSRVRARAADLAPEVANHDDPTAVADALLPLLDDDEVTVVVAACWALGELEDHAQQVGAVARLARITTEHDDPLAREAAVAALGALGDEAGLEAILHATKDKPTVRRRAVLALAPFEGEAVEAALRSALEDRDWQTQQAAEDLLRPD